MDPQQKREALVKAFVRQTKCDILAAELFDAEVIRILEIDDEEPPEYLAEELLLGDLFDHSM